MTCRLLSAIGCILLSGLLPMAPAGASTDVEEQLSHKQQQLEQLKTRIEEVAARLRMNRQQRDQQRSQLAVTERRIGELSRSLDELKHRLTQRRQTLAELRRQRGHQQAQLTQQRQALRQMLQTRYILGEHQLLRAFLSAEEPAALSRSLRYYRFFSDARRERIEALEGTIARLASLDEQIQQKTRDLEQLLNQQREEVAALEKKRAKRQRLLAKLSARIEDHQQRLDQLHEDRQALEQLLEKLSQAATDGPEADAPAFAERRGSLPWPVPGALIERFGAPRQGDVRWQGVFIDAEIGTPVQAVAPGRVVFAEWFRGLGLLVIVDHGDGFMTLYGHNESLGTGPGEWVEAGQVIATTGQSGGRQEAGLYFEIRRQGKPVDPVRWCRR